MRKSIEDIWQSGFIDDMALIAPKVNNLYAMKSKNLVDKFESLFAANQKAVLFAAMVIGSAVAYVGAPFVGAIIAAMLTGLVMAGHGQLKKLSKISKDQSSFEYLNEFDIWLDNAIAQYTQIYRFFYPALFAICTVRYAYSDNAIAVLTQLDMVNSNGMPSFTIYAAIGLISLILGVAGARIYRADVTMVYGREIKKLKALLSEMKALRED